MIIQATRKADICIISIQYLLDVVIYRKDKFEADTMFFYKN